MTEHKWTVEQCCCGCTLRTGSMIIAILSLIGAIWTLGSSAYEATAGHAGGSNWLGVIIAILHFIVTVLLVIGIRQEKRNFIMVWVWVSIVYIVLLIITAILFFIGLVWIMAITIVIQIILYGYFVVVVRSYAISIGGGVGSPA